MIHQVLPDLPARIRKAAPRVQEDPCRFDRGRAQEDDARLEFERVLCLPVDHAHARRAAAPLVVGDAVNDAVRPQREPAGRLRRRQRRVDAGEVRACDAATVARPAVVARRPAVMRLGEHRTAADRDHPFAGPGAPDGIAHRLLDTVQRHRLEEFPVGKLRQPFRLAADADERFDVVVPGRDVGVANRPVDADAFARVGLEVEVAPAIDLPAPHNRAPPDLAAADPRERLAFGRGVGVFEIVDEELVGHLVAGVALLLDRLFAGQALAIAHAAELHLPHRHVLDVVGLGVDRPAGLEDERLQAALGQLLRRPAARHAGADHNGVVGFHGSRG